jgi:hypothetical protein
MSRIKKCVFKCALNDTLNLAFSDFSLNGKLFNILMLA